MKNSKSSNKSLLPVGILAGALIGTVFGVLFAPASGKENRKKLKELSDRLRVDLEKRLGEAKNVTQDSYNQMVDTIVLEYSKKEPLIKEQAKKIKDALKGTFKFPEKKNQK